MKRLAVLTLLSSLLLPACATSQASEEQPVLLALAPIPFRAADIQAASRPGRTYRWRVTAAGQAPVEKQLVFVAVDDSGATVTARDVDDSGNVVVEKTATSTWNELRMHAAFPADITTVEEKVITVPAGNYRCQWYTVREDDGAVSHFCFVLEEPGPPLYFDRWKGETQLMKSELVELAPGDGAGQANVGTP